MVEEMSLSPKDFHPLLKDLFDNIENALSKSGIDPELSKSVSIGATEIIRKNWSGQNIYIPRCQYIEIKKRNAEILKKFNGENYSELAREYGLTDSTIYKLVRENK